MKKYIKIFLLVSALFFNVYSVCAKDIRLKDIHQYAVGFNVEGGDLGKENSNPDQEWLNLCIVLDRPFLDGETWDEITAKNSFPLKESNLLTNNESEVNLAILLIIDYYKRNSSEKKCSFRFTETVLVLNLWNIF